MQAITTTPTTTTSTAGEALARERASIAMGKLEGIIEAGRAQSQTVVERVMSEVPTDRIVKAPALDWGVADHKVALGIGDASFGVHQHALGQAAERAGVPLRYLNDLIAGVDWQQDLAGSILNTHYDNDAAKYLVREVKGSVRAVLSDRYRRLDSRPLLDAFLGEARELGLVPVGGTVADIRVSLKTIFPQVIEPVPGDHCIIGLDWANSDYGAGAYTMRLYLMRLLCLNGLVGENAMSTVHLGRQIAESITLSSRTMELDTEAMISATRDIARGVIDVEAREKLIAHVRDAASTKLRGDVVAQGRLANALNKTEQKRVRELFTGPEVVMLPPEPTKWRLSNALSWMANEADDPMRKLELERLAGEAIGERGGAKEAA